MEDLLELPCDTAVVRLLYKGSLFIVLTLPVESADKLLVMWRSNRRRVSSAILRSVSGEALAVQSITDCLGSKEWPVSTKLIALLRHGKSTWLCQI